LFRQILGSGISIGANIEEEPGGQSRKDFLAKISIAYKETRETYYWLRLLRDSDIIAKEKIKYLIQDCDGL
jgi:four helix bundle protein